MNRAKILLSCGGGQKNYVEAITELGADATAAYSPSIDTTYDGLILCGGGDIHPSYYAEKESGSTDIDMKRDTREFALLKAFLKAGKPAMGICRGHQLINVFFGGTLYQHLSESNFHTRQINRDNQHMVTALEDSIVGKLYGKSFLVNSAHHQAIKKLGDGLRATAIWEDRYIEAIEHVRYPIFGVQWHPERMCFRHQWEDNVCGEAILRYFIDTCLFYRREV